MLTVLNRDSRTVSIRGNIAKLPYFEGSGLSHGFIKRDSVLFT